MDKSREFPVEMGKLCAALADGEARGIVKLLMEHGKLSVEDMRDLTWQHRLERPLRILRRNGIIEFKNESGDDKVLDWDYDEKHVKHKIQLRPRYDKIIRLLEESFGN